MNSDLSAATWSITALSAGTDDIVALSGITIAAPDASFTPSAVMAYQNQTVTYNLKIMNIKLVEAIEFR